MASTPISEAEWVIMNLIWESGPMDAASVVSQIAHVNKWADKTVKSMLHRLVKKSALKAEVHGRCYVYSASVSRSECRRTASRSFLDRVFGGNVVPALMCLADVAGITPEEADEIRSMLDRKFGKQDSAN